jgi:formate C-acetyltransferase
MSVIGHIDRMLGTLYQDDLESGRLTKEEAYDLISRFLLATDAKLDLRAPIAESFNRQEQGDTLILGGRGGSGAELCNDITLMTLKAHGELNLIYPKIHCRISSKSKRELFDAANSGFLKGRNVISFLSDEALIPAQIRAGKRPEDAESYVAGGCWEIILEGAEHSAGANCYFNLAKIIDMSIHDSAETEAATGYVCDKIAGSQSFEELYRTVMDNVIRTIRRMCSIIGKNGAVWPLVNPAPFFSACLSGCLKNRRDYSAGGGRYNPHGLPLTNFAVFIDSLHVVRKLCFEDKKCSLDGLLDAVRADWRGYETLRAKALAVPRFGCDTEDTNTLARRVLDEIYERTSDLKNERGGPFQIGLYSYRDIIDWAGKTRATPDGRKTGDFLSQGLTPSRLNNPGAVTSVINSGAALDLGKCPANSVITVTLPLRGANLRVLEQLERAFAKSGIGLLQLNCVDKEELLDARKHPERHQDLIVRLYGYSARFVCLTPEMQDEFISRNVHSAQSC